MWEENGQFNEILEVLMEKLPVENMVWPYDAALNDVLEFRIDLYNSYWFAQHSQGYTLFP